MIHLSLSVDLEKALRDMSAKSGYPITTICAALMHLGLTSGAKKIDEACTAHARPMGRPQVTSVPALAGPQAAGSPAVDMRTVWEKNGWEDPSKVKRKGK